MPFKKQLLSLLFLVLALATLFLVYGMTFSTTPYLVNYLLSSRYERLLALILTGICVGLSSLIFQSITNNRILTPSIIGLDSIYVFIQTAMFYFLGSQKHLELSAGANYAISLLIMVGFSLVLCQLLFKQQRYSIYFVLLCGLVLNTLFSSMSSFLQMLINPTDFLILQSSLFASFNAINTGLLWLSWGITLVSILLNWRLLKVLDVLLLGKDVAISLGVDYPKASRRLLVLVAILMAIATALVGPVTFLGLLVVNLAYQLFPTYQHRVLAPASCFLAVIALLGGQIVVHYILSLGTSLSVILNFVGGIYFILILLKESKAV